MTNLDTCVAARAVFAWALETKRMCAAEYHGLISTVSYTERCIFRCRSKERFASHALADRVLHRRHIDKWKGLAVYFCTTCSGWHIGNASTLVRKREAEFRKARGEAFA